MQNTELNPKTMAESVANALERNKRRAEEAKKDEQGDATSGTLRKKGKVPVRSRATKHGAKVPWPTQEPPKKFCELNEDELRSSPSGKVVVPRSSDVPD